LHFKAVYPLTYEVLNKPPMIIPSLPKNITAPSLGESLVTLPVMNIK